MKTPSIGLPYIHDKGGIYYPLFIAQNKDTEGLSVVYKSGGLDGRVYVRTLENWNEKFRVVKEEIQLTPIYFKLFVFYGFERDVDPNANLISHSFLIENH